RVGNSGSIAASSVHLGGGHAGVRFSHSVSAMGNDASYVSEIYRFHTHRTEARCHDTNRDIGSQPTYWRLGRRLRRGWAKTWWSMDGSQSSNNHGFTSPCFGTLMCMYGQKFKSVFEII